MEGRLTKNREWIEGIDHRQWEDTEHDSVSWAAGSQIRNGTCLFFLTLTLMASHSLEHSEFVPRGRCDRAR